MIPFRQAIPLATFGVPPVDVTSVVDSLAVPVRFARRNHLAGRTPYGCSMTREPRPSRWYFLPVGGRLTRDDLSVQHGHGRDQHSAGSGPDREFPQARVNTA